MIASGPSEVQQFHDFLGKHLAAGQAPSLAAALEEFRKYQEELSDLRAKLQVAEEQSARGESAPFNTAETMQAVRRRIAGERAAD